MRHRFLFLLLIPFLLLACSSTVGPASDEEPPASDGTSAQLVRADLPRADAPALSTESVAELVQGNDAFAFALYRAISDGNTANLVYSPYSISLAFSMVYAGARGETEAQMAEVLHLLPQDSHHPAFNALDQHLAELGSGEQNAAEEGLGNPFRLNIANAVWGQETFPFHQAYLETLARQYGAGLRAVNFAANPERAREAINGWVAGETEARIEDLVPPGMLTPDTVLVLVNAIYFNASWLWQFDEAETVDAPFTLLDGSTVTVPVMYRRTARIPYSGGEGYQAALMPYAGGNVEMLLLLPATGRFAELEAQWDAALVERVRQQAELRDVELHMPRFEFESEVDLKQVLQRLGLELPFSADADFSGMVEGGGLWVSDALHVGNITVNEKGTEAAAATLVAMEESALERATLTLDRPFLFAILERDTGTILFLGRVTNPVQ